MAATSPSEPQRWPCGKVQPLLGRPAHLFWPRIAAPLSSQGTSPVARTAGIRHRHAFRHRAGPLRRDRCFAPHVSPIDRKNVRVRNNDHDSGDEHKNTTRRGAALHQVPDTDERVRRVPHHAHDGPDEDELVYGCHQCGVVVKQTMERRIGRDKCDETVKLSSRHVHESLG